jgi:hypothetical protein
MLAHQAAQAVVVLDHLLEAVRLDQEILQAHLHLKEIMAAQRVLELLEVLAVAVLVQWVAMAQAVQAAQAAQELPQVLLELP